MTKVYGILVIMFSLTSNVAYSQVTKYGVANETRDMLVSLEDFKGDRDTLAKLFLHGDEKIDDLIRLLDDADRDVSFRAQVVIRYLGNPAGMKAVRNWYANKNGDIWWGGPVPLPLDDWDYANLERHYIGKPVDTWDDEGVRYIYALYLDNSALASNYLTKLKSSARISNKDTFGGNAIRQVLSTEAALRSIGNGNLAARTLNRAFFISASDRKFSSVKFLSFNSAKDKALLQVHINRGVLSEEWYNVVIFKDHGMWRFYSVTLVSVS